MEVELAELSRQLDRMERRIRVIGETVAGGFALVFFFAFALGGPAMANTPSNPWWFLLGLIFLGLSPVYYRWQIARETK